MTLIELRGKFQTLKEVNEELKRIKPIKDHQKQLSKWGNVEARERWRNLVCYEKFLKELKKDYKYNLKYLFI